MTQDSTVITFSVQLGSGGHAIARAVANELGYRFYDREVIQRAAQVSGVSESAIAPAERWPSFVQRIMERLTATTMSDGLLMAPIVDAGLTMRTSADYRSLIEEVVRNLADEGRCVIVGHASQAVLKDDPEVFKTLIHGSREKRSRRHALEEGMTPEAATTVVEADDCQRTRFFKCAYGMSWLNSANYDLTINSDDVSLETAKSWILAGVENRRGVLVPA